MTAPRIILAGGGTGGHVFPAVAVAEALEEIVPGVEICFVGTARGLESRVIPGLGYPLETLEVRYLKGTGMWGWARGLGVLPQAGWQAASILRRFRPDFVLAAGGYASGPVTLMASMRGIPTALMEQNAMPGMTNRLLGKVVDHCFLSMDIVEGTLPAHKCSMVGNPLRAQILRAASRPRVVQERGDTRDFRILVTGGSGGARALNRTLPGVFRRTGDGLATRLTILHQAGRGRADAVRDEYRGFAGKVDVVEFIEDMAEAYAWSDLVVCRSGATTRAELLVMGQPALLVPFAGSADNHQEKNALQTSQAGAAVMVRESELDSGRVERLLAGFAHNPESLVKMGAKARELARPDAARSVAAAIVEMCGKTQSQAKAS